MPKVIGVGPARKRATGEVRSWIRGGRLARGQMLPSEQAMCEELKVSRGTLRAALKDLDDEGILQVMPGRGRVVAIAPISDPETLMSRTVALVTHMSEEPRHHYFGGDLSAIESGVLDGVRQAGLHALVMQMEGSIPSDLQKLAASPPLGLVLGSVVADYFSNREAILPFARSLRLIVNGNDDLWSNCDRVVSDHATGAAELARWLLRRGCKRILRVCTVGEDHYWVRDRNAGFQAALAEFGVIPLPPVWVRGLIRAVRPTKEIFDVRIRQMAGFLIEHVGSSEKPDAIVTMSDTEAYYVAAALRLIGVPPDRDILIAGYDNHWEESIERQWEPVAPAVTVDKLNHQVGEEIIRMLLDRAAGRLPAEPQLRLIKPRLVEVG